MCNGEFIGVRDDLYINMLDVKYIKYEENTDLWIVHEKTFSYATIMKPDAKLKSEVEHYEGPRVSIVSNESSEQAAEITLLGDEATVFWEYMCEHYEYLGADPEQSPHLSVC